MDPDPVTADAPQKPSVGRVVHYRSKRNPYDLPAIVTATKASLWPEGVARGDVKDLDSEYHVHLHVFTPGHLQGYQELNIPCDALADHLDDPEGEHVPSPGSWRWPARA